MQPSKQREESSDDGLGDDLLDDDLAGETAVGDGGKTTVGDDASRVGMDGRYFSVKALLLAALALGAGVAAGSAVPLLGTLGQVAGLFVGAFLFGLLASSRRYVETGVVGAGLGSAGTLLNVLGVGFLPVGLHFLQEYGLSLVAVGAVVGLLLALVGPDFGRDLRAGLTSDVP